MKDPSNRTNRIVFAHGLEGSPDGRKATYLREKLGAHSPWLGELGLVNRNPGPVSHLVSLVHDDHPLTNSGGLILSIVSHAVSGRFFFDTTMSYGEPPQATSS